MGLYDSRAVANYFINKAKEHRSKTNQFLDAEYPPSDYYLTGAQIHKMVFVANGFHLAMTGRALCKTQAQYFQDVGQIYGVFFKELFDALAGYGLSKVTKPLFSKNPAMNRYYPVIKSKIFSEDFDDDAIAMMDQIWQIQVRHNMKCRDWSKFTAKFRTPGLIENSIIAEKFTGFLTKKVAA